MIKKLKILPAAASYEPHIDQLGQVCSFQFFPAPGYELKSCI